MDVAVIPAFNEERTIGTVVLKTLRFVDEVLVVDDGSTDETSHVAGEAGATVIGLAENQGKGKALGVGIRESLDRDADRVVILDGDGQHDPRHIPDLLAPLKEGNAHLVIGSRTLAGEGAPSSTRQAGRHFLDKVTNAASGLGLRDTQSGFRAATAETFRHIPPKEAGMGVESEMLLAASREDFNIAEVSIPNDYPEEATPNTPPVKHGASVLGAVIRFVREEHPLLVFGTGGLILLAIGLYLGYDTASHYYATDEFWPGKAMLSMLFLILASIALLGAMILDAISLQLRGRFRD